MRGGRVGGTEHVASRAARARAERLWHETVARPGAPESNIARPCTPEDDNSGSTAPHLPLSPSPEGGGGTQAAPPVTPSPPPSAARRESEVSGANARRLREMERVAERDRERRGRATSKNPRHPLNGTANHPPLPGGPATRKLRALWISAFHLGLTQDRSDGALVAWLRRQRSLDADTCLSADGLASAVQPLEAWLARAAGVDWRPHLSLGRNGRVRETRHPRARVLEAQWRLLYRQRRVRIGSQAALGAYAARFAGLGRADSHLALSDAQADALIRHLGKCIRAAGKGHG